jgi:TonB family protein
MSSLRVSVGVVGIVFAALLSVSSASNAAIQIKVRAGTASEEVVDLYSEYHALVVGVGEYVNGWERLPNAIKDAEDVARMLGDLGWEVDLVKNPKGQELNLKLNELIVETAGDSDKGVLVWFSGHGHTQEKADGTPLGYLVPADAPDPDRDPAGFISTAIDMDRILSVSNQIRAKHVLMIFDSCFSGTLFATTRSARPSRYIQRKVAKPVRQFITAGQADEIVPDYSVFHQTFLAGIEEREADLNEDSYITGTELGSYLAEKVTNYSGGSQNPVFGKIQNPSLDKGDFVFALAAPPIELESDLTARSNQVDKRVIELEVWREIKGAEDPSLYEQFLRQFPDGVFSGLARHRLSTLNSSAELGWCATISTVFQSTKEYCDTKTGSWSLFYNASKAEYQRTRTDNPLSNSQQFGNKVGEFRPSPVSGNPKPVYPKLAIRQGLEGEVSLSVLVLASGQVSEVSVSKSSGFTILDEAAIKAVKTWEFIPAARNGAPVSMRVEIPVVFRLIDSREVLVKKNAELEKAKNLAEAKAQRERDESEAVSAFSAVAWAIKERVSQNWNEPGDFSGLSVAFLVKVDRQGNVLSVRMNRSSGNARLDESAENAIFKASPLPFPGEARFYEYLKEFNFVFKPQA